MSLNETTTPRHRTAFLDASLGGKWGNEMQLGEGAFYQYTKQSGFGDKCYYRDKGKWKLMDEWVASEWSCSI